MATDETTTEVPGGPEPAEEQPASQSLPAARISRRRLILIDALIAFTTLLAVVGMLSVWANRLLFNPDNWETTSTQLLANSDIRNSTSNYIVDQVYKNVNVAAALSASLPPALQPLADPAAGALRNVAVQGVNLALQRPLVQSLWAKANRAADQTFIALVNGGKGAVGANNGVITLDLASVVDNVAARLGLPPSLGAKLPPSVATLTIFKSNQLKFVQDVGGAVKSLALWLTIIVPLLYLLAIALARYHRRRTLMTVGFAIVFAGIVGVAGRHILESQIVNSLTNDPSLRPAFRATVAIGTAILGTIAGAFIFVGIIAVLSAWFAGPMRLWLGVRRAIAPFLREQPASTFAITAGLLLLLFIWNPIPATGTPIGIIVFSALAFFGTEMLRRETAFEFPDAQRGDATAALGARLRPARAQADGGNPGHANSPLPDQIERLATLRENGSITADEYEAAKARLLHG